MLVQTTRTGILVGLVSTLLILPAVHASVLVEDFNTVTGEGGGVFLVGPGFSLTSDWDTGISGENAFAGTAGYARFDGVSAQGVVDGGPDGSGAGLIDVMGVNFNLVNEMFETATGTGGGMFLVGDGTPDTSGFTLNWDDGVGGEAAFAGTFDGAAIDVGGGATAQALTSGGTNGSGIGQIDMLGVDLGSSGNWYAGLQWDIGPFPGAAPLSNPGFDDNGGTLDPWLAFGNSFAVPGWDVPVEPASGTHVLKFWGNFAGGYNESGVYQEVAAQEGQTWELSALVQHVSTDAIMGTENVVNMAIEFYDADGVQLDSAVVPILDGTSATDEWLAAGPLQYVAPAGTTAARAVFIFAQSIDEGGAGLIDNVSFEIVDGPSGVDLANHSLVANVLGIADDPGEMLGDIQLRIEDTNGNRLVFFGTATAEWQMLGDTLDLAVELDAAGDPAPGAFDVHSPSYAVVVAFDNETGPMPWGTGGTLNVDGLVLTNENESGSTWYAGVFWDNLITSETDLANLYVTADVLGSTAGGNFELRVEAMVPVIGGVDESFNNVQGDCGASGDCVLLDPNDVDTGVEFGFSDDWDTGIEGEGAFAGVYGGTTIWEGGGFFASGLTTGGTDEMGSGEIRVENIILGPVDAGWYAGLDWGDQALASTNLAEVELAADIKGTAASGGSLGEYELRIEDADGDRMYFPMTATGDWQEVGGLLSDAIEGPSLNDGGNGTFDLDSPTYTVVVAFTNEADTWSFGGVLEVDNLYLTPVETTREIGRISFDGTTTGEWQSIGRYLSSGESTFDNLNESFNSVTGEGGGEFYDSGGGVTFGGQPWDTGIEGEEVFAGTWGSGSLDTTSAWGCTSCGVDGTGGGYFGFTGAGGGVSGGWWAGVSWVVPPPDWGNLEEVFAYADVKASKIAQYTLRIEDGSAPPANPIWLAFDHIPTSTDNFEQVGGALEDAVHGCPNPPCAPFNFDAGSYRVTLIVFGDTWNPHWGSEGDLYFDNLFFTGIGFFDATSYTVTLTFENEMDTWGTDGAILFDNVALYDNLCHGDLNCDGLINLADVNPFVLALSNPTTYVGAYPGCPIIHGDANGDGLVNLQDVNPFVVLLTEGATCPE